MIKTKNSSSLLVSIIKYSIPLMMTGILQLFYNAADGIVIGRWDSSNSLAAVTSVGALINLIINVFMGLGVGTAVTVSHDFGANDYEGVKRTIHTSYIVSAISGLIVGAIGCIFSKYFLIWMKSPEEVIGLSTTYLSIYFLGAPALLVYNFAASGLRSVGDTKHPLLFLSISGLVNVVLNIIFVVLFNMSIVGVALATIISQYLSAIMVIIHQLKRTDCAHLDFKSLSIDRLKLLKIIRIGLPAGIQGSIFSLSNTVIQSSVNSFGPEVIAANGAAQNLGDFTYIAQNSIAQSSLTYVGQNVGSKNYERINKVVGICIMLVTVVGLFLGTLTYAFANPLLSLYLPNNPNSWQFGRIRFFYIGIPYFLCGIMEVMANSQRGMGMSTTPMFTSLIGSCALRLVWVYTIFASNPTLPILYLSYPITWISTSAAHSIFYFIKLSKLKKLKNNT
ncbi:MAG: MATE family efflux transporter [Clostridia bacterium]|nr:MATE family efflux transporter [Clostridia bacterium]